jgi:hypothetical protein
LLDAAETYTEFRSIKLNNLKRVKELSDQKLDFLKKLNNQLSEIIKYDSPEEIVASLYILGQAQLNMGESFVNSPTPGELKTPEDIAQYKAGIAKLAEPFFDKAKQSLKAAVDRGNDFEAYTSEYKKAREALVKWDANVLHDGGEIATDYKTTGWSAL